MGATSRCASMAAYHRRCRATRIPLRLFTAVGHPTRVDRVPPGATSRPHRAGRHRHPAWDGAYPAYRHNQGGASLRRPISIQVPRFDVNTLQPQIDDVCNAFDQYLSSYPGRASASKHAVMGPVGKILNEVKSGRMDPTSLKGYALRVHEAAQQFPSMDAVV